MRRPMRPYRESCAIGPLSSPERAASRPPRPSPHSDCPLSLSSVELIPYQLKKDDIGVSPGILSKEADRTGGIADKPAKDPAHLDADKGVGKVPEPQHHPLVA